MLVFRARPSAKKKLKLGQRKSLRRSLGNVSVAVNRMNRSDIVHLTRGQKRPAAWPPAQVGTAPSTDRAGKHHEATHSGQAERRDDSIPTREPVPVVSNDSATSDVFTENHVSNVSSSVGRRTKFKKVPRRSKKISHAKRDACIMTDIALGTEATVNHATVSHLTSNGHLFSSPLLPKKGFAHNFTSSLLNKFPALRNALESLNGHTLPNGYAEDEHSFEDSSEGKAAQHLVNSTSSHHNQENGPPADRIDQNCSDSDYSLTVSIPFACCNRPLSSSASSLNSDASHLHAEGKGKCKGSFRKRSEVQLLLDGDKPRGERISTEEVPVFTAEDPASRATCNNATPSVPSKGSWTRFGTGTRKITPVEPFNYPLSPTLLARKVGAANSQNRKRTFSESNVLVPTPSVTYPPSKVARVAEKEKEDKVSSAEAEEKSEKLEDEDKMKEDTTPIKIDTTSSSSDHPMQIEDDQNLARTQTTTITSSHHPSSSSFSPSPSVPSGDVFSAEIAVFDSRGECLLEEGEYSIFMQKCPKKENASDTALTSFAPLSWSSVFGGEKNVRSAQCI